MVGDGIYSEKFIQPSQFCIQIPVFGRRYITLGSAGRIAHISTFSSLGLVPYMTDSGSMLGAQSLGIERQMFEWMIVILQVFCA